MSIVFIGFGISAGFLIEECNDSLPAFNLHHSFRIAIYTSNVEGWALLSTSDQFCVLIMSDKRKI